MTATSKDRQAAKRARDRAAGIVEVLVRVPLVRKDELRTVAAALRGDIPASVAAGVTATIAGDVDQVAQALSRRARCVLLDAAAVLEGATEDEIDRLERQIAMAADRRRNRHEAMPPKANPGFHRDARK